MKIGVLTYGIEGERMTGIARYAIELTRAMKQLQPDLEIVLLNPYPESDHPWYREFASHPLPKLKLLPAVVTLGNWQLHRAALDLGLDILHDPCGIAPFLAPRAPYKRFTTVHDAVPFVYPETQPLLTRIVFRTLVRSARRTADAILTVSRASAKDLSKFAGLPESKMRVTPLGVNSPPVISTRERGETLRRLQVGPHFFLYVGALHPRKNLTRVLEAFHRVRAHRSDVQLVVVGPPSWGADHVLRGIQGETGAGRGIVLTGFVSDDDLHALYFGAQALVFPSLYEGFGLPPLEAMSHGTPVITSNVSSLPEVVGDAALLVNPQRTSEISRAMERVVQDVNLRRQLQRAGRERAAEFSWRTTAETTLSAYREAVGR